MLTSLLRRSGASHDPDDSAAATHRRADLVIEVDSAAGMETGAAVRLAVDPDRLHIFDKYGYRVDRITR